MKIEADLHTHSVASGHAFSTLNEMAQQASLRGLKMIALTDHGINMPGGPHPYYFSQIMGLPENIGEVDLLKGVEANIIDPEGNLDMPVQLLERLDIVLAGFHCDTGYPAGSVDQNTMALMAAIRNPFVHIISHPGNPEYPVDLEKVVQAAKMAGKALEINNNSFSLSRPGSPPRCMQMARLAARAGILVSINSDAHSCFSVGIFDHAVEVAVRAGIKPEKVLNTSAAFIKEYIQSFGIMSQKIS
ncbi:MAG: hydrolase [Peptococcaceae bacterium BICA1-7]|nr:MAG: hydrolase [Peptococcaceae bacterium BICA1-7]HBV97106.1 phosphatase [Desulfotomaculum sp.]